MADPVRSLSRLRATPGFITTLLKGLSNMPVAEQTPELAALFQAAPLPIFVMDTDWLVRMWNPAAERDFGWLAHEVLGRPLPIIAAGNRAAQLVTEAIEQGTRLTSIQVCRKDGSNALAEISLAPLFDSENEPDGVMAIVSSLTERTADNAEVTVDENDLLAALMESIPDTIYFKDTASRFVRINKSQAQNLGVETPADAVGKTDFDFFSPEHAQDAFADEQRIVDTREPVVSKREKIRLANGHYRYCTSTKVPMVNELGQVTGIAGISRDITEIVLAEEQLRKFATRLEQSNRELQDFASVASHDLQEPLRKIQAFGDRLKSKCGPALGADGSDYLDRMQKAASRMQILINDLLTFSRVSSKAQPFAPVDLNEVLEGVLSDLEVRIEEKGARIRLSNLPTIDADGLQIRQLLQNLISNALKFHRPDEAPRVTITGRVFTLSGSDFEVEGFCEIQVADNGIGFDEKYLDRIFNVFQRLHGRAVYEGTGIGLAVCRKIAERHGGQITATSTPGVGSTFIVRLPLNHQQEEGATNEQK